MKISLTLLLVFLSTIAYPQNQARIDSLLKVVEQQSDAKKKVDLYNRIADEYYVADSFQVIAYTQQAIDLAKSINYPEGVADAYYIRGSAVWRANDYPKAVELYQKQLEIAEGIGYNKGISEAYNGLGLIYLSEGYYPKALEYEFKSLNIRETLKDTAAIAQTLAYIGLCYYGQEEYQKSLEYYFKALEAKETLGIVYEQYAADGKTILRSYKELDKQDQRGLAINFNNIGEVYAKQQDFSHALTYYFNALKILEFSGIGAHNFLPYILLSVGSSYTELGVYDSAANYLDRALAISLEDEDQLLIGLSYNDLGKLYLKQKKYPQAVNTLQKAMEIAKSINNIESTKSAARWLHQAYYAVSNYKKAYETYELYKTVNDSLRDEARIQEVAKLGFEREQELKDKEQELLQAQKDAKTSQELQQRQYVIYAFSIGSFLLLIIVGVIFKNYRDKQRSNALLETQNNAITELYDKTERLLLNILPKETANELKEKGHATTKSYEKVSVLFTDFKGFTLLAERMPPQQLVENLDYCFKAFDRICKAHGLEKIKTIGDAYMAAGGIPKADDNNPQRCINAALEMKQFMQDWKKQKEAKNEEAWEVRIGIHTGPVVAGVVGEDKFAYDIWGDTVNLASRMESSGEIGQVNISETTYKAIKEDALPNYHFHYRGEINAKNKGEVGMYFVEG